MRIAHISDLHFYQFPDWSGLASKRLIGLVNLHVMGRNRQFNPEVGEEAIRSVIEDQPDVVAVTGDLTAMGSSAEFIKARDALQPILSRFPTVIVPGNHDYYTPGTFRHHRIEQYFDKEIRTPDAPVGTPVYPTLRFYGDVAILGLNPTTYSLGAAGRIDPAEAERLEAMLLQPEVERRFKILMIHYPLFNSRGEVTTSFWRKLQNREILLDILMRHPVAMVLHGHDHHRYLNHLHHEDKRVTYIYNAGSASFDRGFEYPIRATYNLYEIENKELVRVIHKDYSPDGFRVSYDGPPSQSKLDTPEHISGY